MVWLRISALKDFVKLWGRIDQDIPAGTNFTVVVSNTFPVASFGGTKDILFSTSSWAGGKNRFLGLAYMAVGIVVGVFWLCVLAKQMIRPRTSDAARLDAQQSEQSRVGSKTYGGGGMTYGSGSASQMSVAAGASTAQMQPVQI